ncbi:MAG: hypothetical protein NWE92_04025 [Candidatus Bathyarchaeota archaeon]|nr:hypothetical protein [Candidatus Bathyarchaeota archaeon]
MHLQQEETVETLVNLGLTVLEAKVYIALVKSGSSTGRATANLAKVAPQDVYRVLTELHNDGLVEKKLAKPNKYRAIPLEKGISLLFQRRNEQTAQLKKSAFKIFSSFQAIDELEEQTDIGDFVLLPKGASIGNRIRRNWMTAKANVDLMNNFAEGSELNKENLDYEVVALDKGVKVREILGKTRKKYRISKTASILASKPTYQVKYLHSPPLAKLMIKDRKEVLLSTSATATPFEYPSLWSNNRIVVQLIQEWYDNIWAKAVSGTQQTDSETEK